MRIFKLAILVLLPLMWIPLHATVINIPADYPTIQTGINASSDGDTVLVHPGIYVENINFNGHNIVLGSLFLTTGDSTYISETVIDGDSAGTVVTFESGEDSTAVITGFTIQNGNGVNAGGIRCQFASPTIASNIIRENMSYDFTYGYGGGISLIESDAIIIRNIIYRNLACNGSGGGIRCFYSNPFISENIINENSACGSGGGILCYYSNAVISMNIIKNNSTNLHGGGISCSNSNVIVINNIIRENIAGYNGGGIVCSNSTSTFTNNIIRDNSAGAIGGGICAGFNTSLIIRNNVIIGNSADDGGRGIGCLNHSEPFIINNIIRNNGSSEIYIDESTPVVTYCNIEGGWEGEGNIDVEPFFRDPVNGDYHLMSTVCGDSLDSPCIDAGASLVLDSLLDCSWGLGDVRSDMGAFGGGDSIIVDTTLLNVPDDYPTIQLAIDACTEGDTVLVQPDTYSENINFSGLNIVVGSMFIMTGDQSFISNTIIDGGENGSVVTFENGESEAAKINGFTLQHGSAIDGGGIYCEDSSPTILNNIIQNNFAAYRNGGGISCWNSNPFIKNNIIINNFAEYDGGGIYCFESDPNIINNTIFCNRADYRGGGIRCFDSSPTIINTILWHDSSSVQGDEIYVSGGSPSFSYSNIQGGWEGEGNIDTDPLFRDPDLADFHLKSDSCGDIYNSPCIDAGDPSIEDIRFGCDWGIEDIRSDMGAYGGGEWTMVDIDDYIVALPDKFALLQNYPNPFNPTTVIRYSLPEATDVRIEIYNILGQNVATLLDGSKQAGYHTVTWQADDYPSGVYFARLEAGMWSKSIKMVLLK